MRTASAAYKGDRLWSWRSVGQTVSEVGGSPRDSDGCRLRSPMPYTRHERFFAAQLPSEPRGHLSAHVALRRGAMAGRGEKGLLITTGTSRRRPRRRPTVTVRRRSSLLMTTSSATYSSSTTSVYGPHNESWRTWRSSQNSFRTCDSPFARLGPDLGMSDQARRSPAEAGVVVTRGR